MAELQVQSDPIEMEDIYAKTGVKRCQNIS